MTQYFIEIFASRRDPNYSPCYQRFRDVYLSIGDTHVQTESDVTRLSYGAFIGTLEGTSDN